MIDATRVTNYERTNEELERFLMFCIAVAGKNAFTTDKAFDKMIAFCERSYPGIMHDEGLLGTIGEALADGGLTPDHLKVFGFGCYNQRAKSFEALFLAREAGRDLRRASPAELEQIPGIGMKTSRYFILHSRKNVPLAALDRHILRWLADHGVERVPQSTPQSAKEYLRLEQEFLKRVPRGMTPAELDLNIWNFYRSGENESVPVATRSVAELEKRLSQANETIGRLQLSR